MRKRIVALLLCAMMTLTLLLAMGQAATWVLTCQRRATVRSLRFG